MDKAALIELRKNYILKGYNRNQIECLVEGKSKGLDVSYYDNPEFYSMQMHQILLGLEAGVDVSVYAKTDYDWFQMEEIRKGLERGLDISKYSDPAIEFKTMREIRKGLEINLDMTKFTRFEAGKMRQLRKALVSKVNILEEINAGYDEQQLDEIRQALEKGIRVQSYITPEFRARAIREIALGLEDGIDVSLYAKITYSWKQMQELRLGIEHRVDIAKYSHKLYSNDQMEEIRLGLEDGVDVDEYRSFMYTAREMRAIRNRLKSQMKKPEVKAEDNKDTIASFQNAKKLSDLEVDISEDGMEAYILLYEKKSEWYQADILKSLYLKGVRKGIISETVDAIARNEVHQRKVLIAKGQEPEKGRDGYYEYFFRTDIAREDRVLPDEELDYQNMEWYETVKKGQKLAVYYSATEGIAGYTVGGVSVPAQKGKEMPILKGRGFIAGVDQKSYFASQNGKITYNDEGIWVVDIIELDHVTHVQGEQFYDGMVIVKGAVENGSVLEATDDIIVEGYVETATIKSGGSVLIRQGMNASNIGSIDAKKMVVAKYFEDANIHAGRRLQADYCMNCNIITEGKVVLVGENGSLIGGGCRAQEGMVLKNAGNRAGIETFISIGAGDEIRRQMDRVQMEIDKAQSDLNQLNIAQQELTEKYPAEVRNTMEVFLKIGSAIFTKNQQLQEMNERKKKIKTRMMQIQYAGIRILEDIFDNVNVEIDEARWVSRGARNVTLKCLNKRISIYQH